MTGSVRVPLEFDVQENEEADIVDDGDEDQGFEAEGAAT